MLQDQAHNFKPDSTIVVMKGFPLKGPCVYLGSEDISIDLKDGKQDECNG